MAKIKIQGIEFPLVVSNEDAQIVLKIKNDPNYKGLINILGTNYSKRKIDEISFDDSPMRDSFADSDIEAFDVMLQEYCAQAEQEFSGSDYWGLSMDGKEWFLKDNPRRKFYVDNCLFGVVHFGIVKYAAEIGAIVKKGGSRNSWFITNHAFDKRSQPDVRIWEEFSAKHKAVRELRDRRLWAIRQEENRERLMDDFLERRGELQETRSMREDGKFGGITQRQTKENEEVGVNVIPKEKSQGGAEFEATDDFEQQSQNLELSTGKPLF